mmetsp:Transcript_29213/g.31865  ORF Transcript_29213/g.31865 Transcript_29213/m.31865 type:complete len:387 (+) Transcript_29213:210-1370(+)|eukprot:gene180-186_t
MNFFLQILCLVVLLNAVVGFQTVRPLIRVNHALTTSMNKPLPSLLNPLPASTLDVTPVTDKKENSLWKSYVAVTDTLTNLFPVWTVLFAGLALLRPQSFSWFNTSYFTWTLGALMLSMGITLTPDDFVRVSQQPGPVIIGFLLCYVLMPALGYVLGKGFKLPVDLVAGLILVGCINGGQASNLCTYIAKGDVALSVLMTTVTTVAGIFMTPLLCKFMLGTIVPVDAVGIAMSCLQVILLPIVLGMGINRYLPKLVNVMLPITPVVGVASTCLLVASAVAQCASAILAAGTSLQFPIILMHLIGGIAGYWIPRYLKFTEVQCRTIAIETAMKSSAFGFLLAKLHFSQFGARIPSAVSVVWMALVGAILGVVWRYIPVKEETPKQQTA